MKKPPTPIPSSTNQYPPLRQLAIKHLNNLPPKPFKKQNNFAKNQSIKQYSSKSLSKLSRIVVNQQCYQHNQKNLLSNQNISLSKVYNIHNSIQFRQFPLITSKHWAVYQLTTHQLLFGKSTKKQIQVASLTKIMNLFTITTILQSHNLNPKQIKTSISQSATNIIGTTASLKKSDIITLQDLIYGMMLPSGNDAAFQIAHIGGMILKIVELNLGKNIYEKIQGETVGECKCHLVRYLGEMNKISKQIGMNRSKWVNPHGLSNKENRTTMEDMCILCQAVMRNQYIRHIVNTKYYQCRIQSQAMNNNDSRVIHWQNTNKMLWKGWNGIKTGVTPNAGPCLAASLPVNENNQNLQFLVVIANCTTMEQRWRQVQSLAKWAACKFKSIN